MIEALFSLMVVVLFTIIAASILLWAIGKWLPEFVYPARLIIGAVAILIILWALLRFAQGSGVI